MALTVPAFEAPYDSSGHQSTPKGRRAATWIVSWPPSPAAQDTPTDVPCPVLPNWGAE